MSSASEEALPARRRFGRLGSWVAGGAGLAVAFWSLHSYGTGHVVSVLGTAGWGGTALVILFHLSQMVCSALGWRAVTHQRSSGPSAAGYLLLRWVREAVNNLLPFTQIGGEVVAIRLLRRARLELPVAVSATAIDLAIEMATQLVFTLLGFLLLVRLGGATDFSSWFGKALLLTSLLFALSVLAVRLGAVRLLERLLSRWSGALGWACSVDGLHEVTHTLLRSRLALGSGCLWHLSSWLLGGLEVCLILHCFGHDTDLARGLIIESVGQASKALGFAIPAALGIQEVGYLLAAQLAGLPAELGLALSLMKRIREVCWGAAGLYVWFRMETGATPGSSLQRLRVAVRGSSWTHLLSRPLVRPLIGTGIRPNHLTTLRALTGLLACVEFARGPGGALWGGIWWLVSAFLDRADGELARLGNMMSAQGHRYDYLTDVTINSLFFAAIGIGLRSSWLGPWAIPLGVVAGVSIWLASLFSEWLELRSPPGTRAYAGRWGFDPEDALYLMSVFAWLGWLAPILVASSAGATVMMLITGVRLMRLRRRLSPNPG